MQPGQVTANIDLHHREPADFNLAERPWIPVRTKDGERRTVSLVDVLGSADRYLDLDLPNPQEWISVFRLLLAIIHRSYDGPRDSSAWGAIRDARRFDQRVADYLDRWKSRFDLFDPGHPFLQQPSLAGKEQHSVSLLFPHRASGNNATLFDHATDEADFGVDPAEAALGLLVTLNFACEGQNTGIGSAKKAPLAGELQFVVLGNSLFETLLLNAVDYDPQRGIPFDPNTLRHPEADAPFWEGDATEPGVRFPRGYTDYLTWVSRGILLVPSPKGVQKVRMGPGWTLDESWNPARWDPFIARRQTKDGSFFSIKLKEGKACWRDSSAILYHPSGGQVERPKSISQAVERRAGETLTVAVLGVAVDQAKYLFSRREVWEVPRPLIESAEGGEFVEALIDQTEKTVITLRLQLQSVASHLLSADPPKADKLRASKMVQSWKGEDEYWATVGTRFWHFIMRAGSEPLVDLLDEWIKFLIQTRRTVIARTVEGLPNSRRTWEAVAMAESRPRARNK